MNTFPLLLIIWSLRIVNGLTPVSVNVPIPSPLNLIRWLTSVLTRGTGAARLRVRLRLPTGLVGVPMGVPAGVPEAPSGVPVAAPPAVTTHLLAPLPPARDLVYPSDKRTSVVCRRLSDKLPRNLRRAILLLPPLPRPGTFVPL